jgi:uncharacterized membrane protein YhaH (DUF805 family)
MLADTSSPSEAFYSPLGCIARRTYWLRLIALAVLILASVWWGNGLLPGSILLTCLLLLPLQVMKRGRDTGWGAWIAFLLLVPGVNLVALLILGLVPTTGVATVENEATPVERARLMDELIRQMK